MCQKFGLPVEFHKWDKEELYQALTLDKEGEGQSIKTRFGPRNWHLSDSSSPIGRNERLLKLETDKGDTMRYLTGRRITRTTTNSHY